MTQMADDREPFAGEEELRRRAYERWQARGGTDGGDVDDWLAAEREIRETSAARAHPMTEGAGAPSVAGGITEPTGNGAEGATSARAPRTRSRSSGRRG